MKTDDPSYVLKIDKRTGKTIWRVERLTDAVSESPDSYTTPLWVEAGGRRELVITGGDVISGHDPNTGAEYWRADVLNPQRNRNYRIVASPTLVGGLIIAPTRENPMVAIRPGGTGDVAPPMWRGRLRRGRTYPRPSVTAPCCMWCATAGSRLPSTPRPARLSTVPSACPTAPTARRRSWPTGRSRHDRRRRHHHGLSGGADVRDPLVEPARRRLLALLPEHGGHLGGTTDYHFENMTRFLLLTSLIVGYAYLIEYFIAWYSGVEPEKATFWLRLTGPYWFSTWTMITCNVIFPQVILFQQARRHIPTIFVVSTFINIGMWFERYVIIITGLSREYDPAVWGVYTPSPVELTVVAGSFAFFAMFFLIFIKIFPVVAIAEVKELAIHEKAHAGGGH